MSFEELIQLAKSTSATTEEYADKLRRLGDLFEQENLPGGHFSTLYELGTLEMETGRVEAAIEDLQRALGLIVGIEGADSTRALITATRLSSALYLAGNLEDGVLVLERALAASAANVETGARVQALVKLGLLYSDLGRDQAARQTLTTALEADPKLDPVLISIRKDGLRGLAALALRAANYDEAERWTRLELAESEAAFGDPSPELANATRFWANLRLVRRDFSKAEASARRVLEMAKLVPVRTAEIAGAHVVLAVVAQYAGDYDDAEQHFRDAVRLFGGTDPSAESMRGIAIQSWANLRFLQGNYRGALDLMTEALSLRRSSLDTLSALTGMDDLGLIEQQLAVAEGDMAALDRAVARHERVLAEIAKVPSARHQPVELRAWEHLATAQWRKGAIAGAEGAFSRLVDVSETIFDEQLQDGDSGDRLMMIKRFQPAGEKLISFALAHPNSESSRQLAYRWTLQAKGRVLDTLIGRGRQARRPGLAQIKAALPDDAALVDYVLHRPFDASKPFAKAWGALRYVAYVLPPEGPIRLVDLGPAADIESAIQRWRATIEDRTQSAEALDASQLDLRSLVWSRVERHLGPVQRIYLSADAALHLVPFGALGDGPGHYLVERIEFTYLNSAGELAMPASTSRNENALVVADPDFGFVAVSGSDRKLWKRLSGSRIEGQSIQQSLERADLLMDKDPTEARLREAMPGNRVLHFATHAYFPESVRSIASAPGLSSSGVLSTDMHSTEEWSRAALESSIVVANANLPSRAPNDDGYLRAHEIVEIDLRGTSLVVLSACNTGRGHVRSGEGVFGLRRAFSLSGVEALIMSLWKVPDSATAILMSRFYKSRAEGASDAEALRSAQRSMMNGPDSHPRQWAAFVIVGGTTLSQNSVEMGP